VSPLLLGIPNVSEGRDPATVAAIGAAYMKGGARLLDTHSDHDHHRSVHTLAAPQGALADALVSGARAAVRHIDLTRERGIHPHVGAIDVVPVVFLDAARRGAACAEALIAGEELGRLGLPVFLYGALADGRSRADLRRGGIGALSRRVAQGELRPDFGPDAIDARHGAVLVAARPPLVAFNVELAAPASLGDAQAIAARIREGGEEGLPGVRAMGVELAARDAVAQVSVNVEDHLAVPLARLVAAVAQHAQVAECELVGLAPEAAFDGFPNDVPVRNRRTIEVALAG
jgi:glutamate formiminotransferase